MLNYWCSPPAVGLVIDIWRAREKGEWRREGENNPWWKTKNGEGCEEKERARRSVARRRENAWKDDGVRVYAESSQWETGEEDERREGGRGSVCCSRPNTWRRNIDLSIQTHLFPQRQRQTWGLWLARWSCRPSRGGLPGVRKRTQTHAGTISHPHTGRNSCMQLNISAEKLQISPSLQLRHLNIECGYASSSVEINNWCFC